jgi:A/G-specific adenine glycosylase
VRGLPGGHVLRVAAAGSPPYDGPVPAAAAVRRHRPPGARLLLDVLRAADGPVPPATLDAVWSLDAAAGQGLAGLVADGLVDPLPDGTVRPAGPARASDLDRGAYLQPE